MSKPRVHYVLDLGGSIVNPGELNALFLKEFQRFCFDYVKQGKRFAIVVGGGILSRLYQGFLREHFDVSAEDLDRIGIRPTMLNAELVRIVLKPYAYPLVIENPHEPLQHPQRFTIFVFSGWKGKTGRTTDYVSIVVAKRFRIKEVISLTNITGVYEVKNGELQRGKVIPRMRWKEYEDMVGALHSPGMKVPFDPVATREAKKQGMKVAILQGMDLENVKRYMEREKFLGTVIS